MELLRSYDSEDPSSEDCESFQEALGGKEVRSVYLITYSQANLDLFPTREEFASAVVKSFANAMRKLYSGVVAVKTTKNPENTTIYV